MRTSTLQGQVWHEGVRRLRLRSCQVSCRLSYVTLATHPEQAFLCSQGYFYLDIYGAELPWTLLGSFSTCGNELARLYVQ
jgi:hypothetical protein